VNAPAPALEAVDVTRTYQLEGVSIEALRGVSLRIGAGEYVAVIGPSGSGKSTLMHLLGCLDRPSAGSLKVGGRDITALTDAELAALRNETIGFVFQSFQLLSRTSALENVALPLVYRGIRRAERRRLATEALVAVGLGHRLKHRPGQLSGGEQQRVAIARALVGDPQVLLADEPTGNLDTRSGEEVMGILERLNGERGVAVVLVTHEADIAVRARRLVRMRDGLVESDEPGPASPTPATARRVTTYLPPGTGPDLPSRRGEADAGTAAEAAEEGPETAGRGREPGAGVAP
jgi:putative ABC transport system ATP-binding protein